MLRILAVAWLLPATVLLAAEPENMKLAAPAGWGGETIQLPPGFAPDLKRAERDPNAAREQRANVATHYLVILDWVEPFATKKPQKLTLEIQTWTKDGRNYVFACVSPQARNAAIWKQLHVIRDNYLKS